MASWFAKLKNGTAAKSNLVASTAISGGAGASIRWGEYNIINYTGTVGVATEAYADCPPAWTIMATVNPVGANAYLLPWGPNKVCWTRIQAAHDMFFTHAMNGCGVFIAGNRASPTVVHANAYDKPARLDNLGGEEKAEARRGLYGGFITHLQGNGTLADNVATWYPGSDYRGGKSGVFGVRVSGHWVFYGHANRGSQADTKVIWPPDAVVDEADDVGGGCCKGCFITTAVCSSLGLPDDCEELQVLRRFRDEVMRQSPAGRRDIATYYATAPGIVAAIDRRPDAAEFYHHLHRQAIHPAVTAIQRGEMQQAYDRYRDMMQMLERVL